GGRRRAHAPSATSAATSRGPAYEKEAGCRASVVDDGSVLAPLDRVGAHLLLVALAEHRGTVSELAQKRRRIDPGGRPHVDALPLRLGGALPAGHRPLVGGVGVGADAELAGHVSVS